MWVYRWVYLDFIIRNLILLIQYLIIFYLCFPVNAHSGISCFVFQAWFEHDSGCYCHSSFSRFLPFPSSSMAQGFCLFLAKGGVKRDRTLLCTLETARMFPLEFLFPPVVGLLWPPFSSTVTVAFSTCKALYVLAVWTHITFTLVYRRWWTVSFHRWEGKNPGLYKQKMWTGRIFLPLKLLTCYWWYECTVVSSKRKL